MQTHADRIYVIINIFDSYELMIHIFKLFHQFMHIATN